MQRPLRQGGTRRPSSCGCAVEPGLEGSVGSGLLVEGDAPNGHDASGLVTDGELEREVEDASTGFVHELLLLNWAAMLDDQAVDFEKALGHFGWEDGTTGFAQSGCTLHTGGGFPALVGHQQQAAHRPDIAGLGEGLDDGVEESAFRAQAQSQGVQLGRDQRGLRVARRTAAAR